MRTGSQLLALAVGLAGLNIWAQAIPLTGEPRHDSGQSIIGAYEGWFPNADGSFSLLAGYYNRNFAEEVDIPIGPNNKIEPGGPDQGQPTHFYPGRGWGNFVVRVPHDFGDKKLTWTITANGKTTTMPFGLEPLWEISPMSEIGMGNTPPVLSLDEGGPTVQGPAPRIESITAKVGVPVTLTAVVKDDAKTFPGARPPAGPAVVLTWTKFRGPGEVKFANAKPPVAENKQHADKDHPFAGKATTTAVFSQPGEYELNVTANDWSGEGGRGFLCCWTNAHLKITVTQ
jgi:hypothetical protein